MDFQASSDSYGPLSYSNNKIKLDKKLEKYYVTIIFLRNPTSEMYGMYRFRMELFDNGQPEEFLLFKQNYKMALDAWGTLTAGAKNQYLRMILRN